ncbi:MAG: hypothetical protein FWD28_07075 [Treponema sp.]|nr:hypothetical protein [Treponema sp.]
MQTLPLKWKKYLMMAEYNLTTIENLEKQIFRFSIDKIADFYYALKKEIIHYEKYLYKNLFVVKLVKNDAYFMLPNIRVHNLNEFNDLSNKLTNNYLSLFDEIWFCKTLIDDSVFSVAGRFCVYETNRYSAQLVEQLWNRSPRLIEIMSNKSDFAYVRAERIEWGRRYKILEIHPSDEINDEKIKTQFYYSMLELERNREKIELFILHLRSFGLEIISIEYKIINGFISFIDWDTNNDSLVLR